MEKLILTGGGTAGHIIPNIALIPHLEKKYELHYIGTSGMEKEIITSSTHLPFHEIVSSKLIRRLTFKNFAIPFYLMKGVCQAKKHLKRLQPCCVFSKGGYVSVPVVIAAFQLGIPVVCHESDLSMGLANKICLAFSRCLCTSFLETAQITRKGVHTGSPIRESLFHGKREVAKKMCQFTTEKPVLLCFGGSLGAKAINMALREALPSLEKQFNVIHITGKGNVDASLSSSSYFQLEFTNQIEHLFAYADLCVCRSGSNAIFELLALHKPMLLIPLSKRSSRGDQIENAQYFAKNNFALVLQEENLTSTTLVQKLNKLQKNKDSYVASMKKSLLGNGCKNIAIQIEKWKLKTLNKLKT